MPNRRFDQDLRDARVRPVTRELHRPRVPTIFRPRDFFRPGNPDFVRIARVSDELQRHFETLEERSIPERIVEVGELAAPGEDKPLLHALNDAGRIYFYDLWLALSDTRRGQSDDLTTDGKMNVCYMVGYLGRVVVPAWTPKGWDIGDLDEETEGFWDPGTHVLYSKPLREKA